MKHTLPLTIMVIAIASALPLKASYANNPLCQDADSDADGDGWGWENFQTCVVPNSSASAASANATASAAANSNGTANTNTNTTSNNNNVTTTQVAPSKHPACTSANVDPDGDGWGWENNASCIVTVTTQSAATQVPLDTTTNPLPTDQVAIDQVAIDNPQSAENPPADTSQIINGLYLGRVPVCSSPSSDIDGDGWGFEFHDSCKVVAGYVAPGSIPDVDPVGNSAYQEVGIIYQQDFDLAATGLYQGDQLNTDWQSPHWHLGFDQGRVSIVDAGGSRGNAMQVTYPAGRYGAGGASAFLSDVQFGMGLPKTYEELYVAYDIRFAQGFDFVKGGKLPGLCGADVTQAPSTGCNTGGGYPTGYDGWSARGMWREDGALENYVYHASQRNYYGDDEFWNVKAIPGVWHRVVHRVVLNTPGIKNGILEAWFDGTKVLSLKNLEFRKTNNIGINLFYFSTFFGGNDASWAPSTDQTMNFDNFVLSTDRIR